MPVVSICVPLPRVQSLQLHHELDLAHLCASTDPNSGRARRRAWQQRLNGQIQQITLQLLVSILRYVRPFLVSVKGTQPTRSSTVVQPPKLREPGGERRPHHRQFFPCDGRISAGHREPVLTRTLPRPLPQVTPCG